MKVLRLLDWDTRDVLAEEEREPIVPFPLEFDWEQVFKKVEPKDGFEWNLLYDSCDGPEDEPIKEGGNEVYIGYVKSVDLREYWTQHDDSGRHKDGIRELKDGEGRVTGWKIYDPDGEARRKQAQEYADALANSPFFYFLKDVGSCQKPNQERVYRIFVDPDDPTKISSDYWGNLGSTPDKIYSAIYLVDVTDKEHIAKLTIQNGKVTIEEQPFYLSSADFANCFGSLFVIPLDDRDSTSEELAQTNNELLDALKMSYNISEVQALRHDYPSKRNYITIDNIKTEFKNVLNKHLDPENFDFDELRSAYRNIIQDLANTVNNTQHSNPKTSGLKYVTAHDFRSVFSGIVDNKVDLEDFTLEEVCEQVNGIIESLNNLIEGA